MVWLVAGVDQCEMAGDESVISMKWVVKGLDGDELFGNET